MVYIIFQAENVHINEDMLMFLDLLSILNWTE